MAAGDSRSDRDSRRADNDVIQAARANRQDAVPVLPRLLAITVRTPTSRRYTSRHYGILQATVCGEVYRNFTCRFAVEEKPAVSVTVTATA
jgi:hypothetical protein